MRLIDADALRKAAKTCRETTEAFLELIDAQPTAWDVPDWYCEHGERRDEA